MSDIYRASVINVREIKIRAKNIKRMINDAVINNRNVELETLTYLYALLYSAFAEVSFLKLINTPYGFSETNIKDIQSMRNLEEKWKKTIELAFQNLNLYANLGDIANKKMTLLRILKAYIVEPSQIRNKIAHGQWKVALTNDSTKINQEVSDRINELDFVEIHKLFTIYDYFERCVEDLIESPKKAHYKFFYSHLTDLEEYIVNTKDWSLDSAKADLIAKKERKRRIDSE